MRIEEESLGQIAIMKDNSRDQAKITRRKFCNRLWNSSSREEILHQLISNQVAQSRVYMKRHLWSHNISKRQILSTRQSLCQDCKIISKISTLCKILSRFKWNPGPQRHLFLEGKYQMIWLKKCRHSLILGPHHKLCKMPKQFNQKEKWV